MANSAYDCALSQQLTRPQSCLTCYSCNRRLDSFSLVEHNEEVRIATRPDPTLTFDVSPTGNTSTSDTVTKT